MPSSTGVIQHVPGETVTLVLAVTDDEDRTNEPITGESPTVAVRRTSDDKWYDFVATTWDVVASYAALGAEHKQALTDKSDGSYEYDFGQATIDASVERTYEMVYAVPGGTYQGITYETRIFTLEVPGAVWTADLVAQEAAAKTGTTAGAMLIMARAFAAGRIAIAGSPPVLTVYEVDGVTVIATTPLAADYSTRAAPS